MNYYVLNEFADMHLIYSAIGKMVGNLQIHMQNAMK